MGDYEFRIDRIRTTIRACLDSHDEEEDFFSASDGGDDSPPRSPRHDDQAAPEEKNGNNMSAADRGAACAYSPSTGILSDAATADDRRGGTEARWTPLPATDNEESGPTSSRTEHKTRVASTSNSTPIPRSPDNGNPKHPGRGGASSRRQATEEPEPNSCVAGRRNVSNSMDDKAAAQNLIGATHHEPCGIVSFAGVSVCGLRLLVKEHDPAKGSMIVRVSDQHGHLAETAPRPFPRHKSLPSGDGTMANGATCRVWCEELQVPIFPDVDGVLFELLLVSTPRDPEDGRDGLESIDATGDDGSNSGRSPDLGGPCTAKAVNNRPKRNTSIGGSVTSPGESLVASCAGGGQTTESRSCTFVGAVALLLSEVVGAWREMESPLFDSAGGVAGTIKLAARMLGGETTKAQEAEKPAAQESYRSFDGAEALTPAAYHETKSKIMAAGLSVTEAVTSPPAPSGLAMTDINDVSPANRMAKPEGRRRERRGASPPTSVCYAQSNGSSRGSRCSAPVGPAQARSMFSCTEAALERRPFEPVRADDMAPTATIIYMGVKLPFRWFRSGTVKGIDQALREVLGINDASIASPVLYDVGTGDRMNLEPGTPSGRTFLAVLERPSSPTKPSSNGRGSDAEDGVSSLVAIDQHLRPPRRHHIQRQAPQSSKHLIQHRLARYQHMHDRHGSSRTGSVTACGFFRYHDQVSGRSRPLSTSRTTPNRPLLRRSLSAGDMVRRSSQLVARRRGTTKKQAPSQAGRAHVSSGTGPAGSCRGFAEEVIKLQQQRYEQRKRDRLEVRRRQDKELAKAKAMACQLACRVLCRGHRTRVLAAALWRWRTQAAGLKMEQDRRDEQRREHEQATALLERLRQEVASLISSTYEGLVAVSIDALESDFQASSSSVTEEQSTDDLGTKSTPRDRFSDVRSTNEAIGVTGREGPNDDKENVGRAVAALKKDISRLSELAAQKAQCLQQRLRERRDVQGLTSAVGHSAHSTTTAMETAAAWRVKARPTPVSSSRRSKSFSPERRDASNTNPSKRGKAKQNKRTDGGSPEHPSGHGMQLASPPAPSSSDDLKEGSAGAGADTDASASAGDDGRLVPSFLVPSLPLKTGAEGIGRDRSRGMETQQTAPGARWGTTRDQSGDDEVLGCFLARHAKEGFPPLGEGTWRQRGLENDAAPSELEAKVLWALFQVFSKCPPLPPYKLPTPSPATADGDAAKFTSASPDVHDRALRGRIDLPAFLEVCSCAGLLSPAVKVARSCRGEGFALGISRGRSGQADCRRGRGRASDCGGYGERLRETGTEEDETVAAPRKNFFLLSRADAASVFARIARRYGSADAVVHNRNQSRSPADNQRHHRQHTRRGRARRSRHGCCRSQIPAVEEGPSLDFQQFVAAIGGVIELLTVGCDDHDSDSSRARFDLGVGDLAGVGIGVGVGGCCRESPSAETVVSLRDQGSRSPERDPGELGLSRSGRAGASTACFGRKGGQEKRSSGGGDGGERYGVRSSERRMISAMTPALAKNRLVRLAKTLADQELQIRDRQARETLALLDPSLQTALDANTELLRKVFAHYCHKPALQSGPKPRPHAHVHTSPRSKKASAIGTAKLGGGGGAARPTGLPALTMSFEGGKAFATDVGLVASAQELAEVWEVAWAHQRAVKIVREPSDKKQQAVQDAPVHSPAGSKFISFSGFLDFLGRCALRFGQTTVDGNRRPGCSGSTAALPVYSMTLDGALGSRNWRGEPVRTAALGKNGDCKTGGSDACGHNSLSGLSMLTLLRWIDASGVDGRRQAPAGS